MKLIDDVKNAWAYTTVWGSAVVGSVAIAYDYLPAIQQYMPVEPGWGKWLPWLIILARVIKFKEAGK